MKFRKLLEIYQYSKSNIGDCINHELLKKNINQPTLFNNILQKEIFKISRLYQTKYQELEMSLNLLNNNENNNEKI